MNLKRRLSLFAVCIFGVIILTASLIIYITFHNRSQHLVFQNLENKTILAAIYYLEKDEVSIAEHESTSSRMRKTVSRGNIAIFDSLNKMFDGQMEADTSITPKLLNEARQHEVANVKQSNYFYTALYYKDNQGDFVIVAREPTTEFDYQMQSLLQILIAVSLIGLILVFVSARLLGRIAYNPILNIMEQLKIRDVQNFQQPLTLTKTYSEVENLVATYNHFIERISKTFEVQKNFIDYVSHELRTPITAILGSLEVASGKERSSEEYREVIHKAKQYTQDLNEVIDQMMLLSGAKINFEFEKIRIDELLFEIMDQQIQVHNAQIIFDFKVVDESLLHQKGNSKMLFLAIQNILSNAIKYSKNDIVNVSLFDDDHKLYLTIADKGVGIPQEDLKKVTDNFYRGENAKTFAGKGIGLSLAKIIFNRHQIQMKLFSNNLGTTVKLCF